MPSAAADLHRMQMVNILWRRTSWQTATRGEEIVINIFFLSHCWKKKFSSYNTFFIAEWVECNLKQFPLWRYALAMSNFFSSSFSMLAHMHFVIFPIHLQLWCTWNCSIFPATIVCVCVCGWGCASYRHSSKTQKKTSSSGRTGKIEQLKQFAIISPSWTASIIETITHEARKKRERNKEIENWKIDLTSCHWDALIVIQFQLNKTKITVSSLTFN